MTISFLGFGLSTFKICCFCFFVNLNRFTISSLQSSYLFFRFVFWIDSSENVPLPRVVSYTFSEFSHISFPLPNELTLPKSFPLLRVVPYTFSEYSLLVVCVFLSFFCEESFCGLRSVQLFTINIKIHTEHYDSDCYRFPKLSPRFVTLHFQCCFYVFYLWTKFTIKRIRSIMPIYRLIFVI